MAWTKAKDFTAMDRSEILESAKARIYRSAVAREQSTARMRDKLQTAGYPSDVAEEAIGYAVGIGVLDDVRYSECLIRSTIAANKGLSNVEKEIESLGIDINALEAYQEYRERGEEAEIDDAVDVLIRHPSKAKDRYGSSFRKLVSKGFSSHIASAATRKYFEMMKDR